MSKPADDDPGMVEVWHYSTRNGKRVLVQHFKTRWDYEGAVKEVEKASRKKAGRKKAS